MPGGRALPNLALQAFFDLGEEGWDDDMSLNLLKLSVLTQGNVTSKVSATPESPTNGDVHIFDGTHPTQPNKVAIRDNGAWIYITPVEGWLLYNKNLDRYEKFNGSAWVELNTASTFTPNIQSVASSATVTPTFTDDQVNITAQAAGLTVADWSGTAVDAWGLVIRVKDNGTSRSIAYGAKYRAINVTLPSATVVGKTLYLGMVYNLSDDKFDVLSVGQE